MTKCLLLPVTIYHLTAMFLLTLAAKNVLSQLPFKQRPLKIFIFQTFLAKVTHSLSELHRPLVTVSLSAAKRTFLYHDSSVSVLDSLPAGHPYPSRSLCGLFFDWLSDVLSWIMWSDFQSDMLHFVIPTSPFEHTNAMPWKFASEWKLEFMSLFLAT